ncbi:MAG: hypothetical protein IKO07_11950 [Clostridia bacterium]|nr:hypothetical protein [Clostridia bacterium]
MKNHFNRAFALIVALLVLCAPMAMADDLEIPAVNLSLALSNFRVQIGDQLDATVDITAQIDLTADLTAGDFAGTLTALAGEEKAIKGGFAFDPATMNLTAALEGATDAVLLPMGEIIESVQASMSSATSEGMDLETVEKIANVATNLVAAAENADAEAFTGLVMTWIGDQITGVEEGVSLTVDDVEITADRYDFEVTLQELAALAGDLAKTVQADPDLTAAIQDYIDLILEMSGEEVEIDLATMDVDALLEQIPEDEVMTLAGSLYVNGEEGHVVLDMTVTATEDDETVVVPYQVIVLNMGDYTYVSYATEFEEDGETVTLTVDVNATNDDKAVFDVNVAQTTDGDDGSEYVGFTLSVDCSDGADITLYVENSSEYTYGDETYNALTAFGVNYTGTTIEDETGVAATGTLTFYLNQDGQEMTFAADTLAALTADSYVTFDMPNNVIDLAQADDDTMEALGEEYMQVLYTGLTSLMSAPGIEDLSPVLGGLMG